MAGDWLKIEVSTPDKAEVFSIAEKLSIQPTDALGRLILVWRWFDQHTETGNAASVTEAFIDHVAGVTGFAKAMVDVHWLNGPAAQGGEISLPNFDRHNGKTAKTRALTAKRVADHKKRNGNASLTHDALPREEKRRSTPLTPQPASSDDTEVKRTRRGLLKTGCPGSFEVSEEMAAWAEAQGLPAPRVIPETEKFLDYFRGAGGLKTDWNATWRNWIRKAVEIGARR